MSSFPLLSTDAVAQYPSSRLLEFSSCVLSMGRSSGTEIFISPHVAGCCACIRPVLKSCRRLRISLCPGKGKRDRLASRILGTE
jgi:hypothetical protein